MFGGGNSSTGQSGGAGGFSFGAGTGSGSVFGSGSAGNDKPKTEFSGFGGFGSSASAAPGGASIFGAAKPTASTDAAKPATPVFGLGTPANNTSGGGLFGAASLGTAAATPAATSKADGAKSVFSFGSSAAGSSGGLFGAASAATSTPAAGFSVGTSSAAAISAAASAASATAASAGGLFSFGPSSAAKSGASAPAAAAAAASNSAANPTAGTGLGGFKLSTTPVASGASADDKKAGECEAKPAAAASAPAPAPAAGCDAVASTKIENSTDLANAALRGKTLEEIAQMWTSELAAQTRAFHTQANTVSYWDRALVQQGKRITELYEATMAVEAEQAALDQSLEHMEGQQSALQNLLDTYEGHVQDIVSKTKTRSSGSKGVAMTADEERDHVYSSAERLNTQLDELTRRLTTLVEDVNAISSANTGEGEGQRGNADPFAQIVQILNAHLSSLEWIDSQTAQLQDRVKSAQRVYQDVSSAQSSLSGAYGANEPPSSSASNSAHSSAGAAPRRGEPAPVMPGSFCNDPAPPAVSSFGMPASATRRQQGFSFFGFGGSGSSASRRGF